MTIRQMQYFVAVCVHMNITKASEQLHVSQSSVSVAIKDMEAELNVNLFNRSGKKVVLTKEGAYAYEKIESLLQSITDVTNDLKQLSNTFSSVSLGVPTQVGSYLLPAILRDFETAHSNISLEIKELGTYHSLKLLEQDELDLTLYTQPKEKQLHTMQCEKLFESQAYLYAHKDHPLASCQSVTFAEISQHPLALLDASYLITSLVEKGFAEEGLTPNISLHTSHLLTLKNMIQNNLAASVLLQNNLSQESDIVVIPLETPIFVDICVAYKTDKLKYKNIKSLLQFLKNLDYPTFSE